MPTKDSEQIAAAFGDHPAVAPAPAGRRALSWVIATCVCAIGVGAALWLTAGRPVPAERVRGVPPAVTAPDARPDAHRRYRGGPARDGRFPVRGPARLPPPDGVLRYAVGAAITGQAVVGDGGVYFAAHDGFLYALDRDLQLRFRRALGGIAFAGPVLTDSGELVVGSDAGRVLCFAPDGSERFAYDTGDAADTAVALHPAGFWLVAAGRRLHAVDPHGARRFVFEAADKIFSTPAIDAVGRIYISSQDDTVRALSASGELLWEAREAADLDAGPLLHGGRLFVGDDTGTVHAYDAATGRRLYRRTFDGALRAPPALGAADTLLFSVYGPRARLLGLDPSDGGLRFVHWYGPADGPGEGARSAPAVDAAGWVYVGSHDGCLHALHPDGREAFRFPTHGVIDASPVIGPDGTLYFGSRDGVFYALRSR